MKILSDVESTLEYIKELRKSTYSNILTSGNGFFEKDYSVEEYVKKIMDMTKLNGDDFLFELSSKLDDEQFGNLQISEKELKNSVDRISKEERNILENTISRIENFQKKTLIKNWFDEKNGYGEYIKPIKSVGCYIPGGTAPLISTVLHTVIPAKVAGVKQISIASPATGIEMPNNMLLAAAYLSGVDNFYTYGGPQAIISMAVGTKKVSKVDMICGPGNIFVMTAKKLVYGEVGLDGIFGPTETMIVADSSSNIEYVVGDLMAQAEHDVLALPMMATNSLEFAKDIQFFYKNKLNSMKRKHIIEKSMNRGFISVLQDEKEIIELVNQVAPEHLSIASEKLINISEKIDSAGSIFLGEISSEVLADYVAGPSHVMPTNGSARYSSSLSSRTFQKSIPVLAIDKKTFKEICNDAENFAKLESLQAHSEAISIRKEKYLME
ncbi:MAG: histidinol dehydrogenase [SAR202 cluster bacterium]|jgi:histidinol dehydrogenase|nr:MAG: histidinol dehydrogenase [SAR202 cluster bacterium]KAA1299202.1 MAG: histidinol dehydrogenase [SAR202 cluster bacterium]|tara:strand:- start:2946 stop:4262 length:1317 start_codon:yes stop_codon:yes gene_type:complete